MPSCTEDNKAAQWGLCAQHFGNDAFERVAAPPVAEAMDRRLRG